MEGPLETNSEIIESDTALWHDCLRQVHDRRSTEESPYHLILRFTQFVTRDRNYLKLRQVHATKGQQSEKLETTEWFRRKVSNHRIGFKVFKEYGFVLNEFTNKVISNIIMLGSTVLYAVMELPRYSGYNDRS